MHLLLQKRKYQVDWKNTKNQIKLHKKYGEILIITGEIVNNDTSRMIPRLACDLYTYQYKSLLHIKGQLSVGIPISENDLLEMSKEEITKQFLKNGYPDGTMGRTRSQFTAVFFNIPDDLNPEKIFVTIAPEKPKSKN